MGLRRIHEITNDNEYDVDTAMPLRIKRRLVAHMLMYTEDTADFTLLGTKSHSALFGACMNIPSHPIY